MITTQSIHHTLLEKQQNNVLQEEEAISVMGYLVPSDLFLRKIAKILVNLAES